MRPAWRDPSGKLQATTHPGNPMRSCHSSRPQFLAERFALASVVFTHSILIKSSAPRWTNRGHQAHDEHMEKPRFVSRAGVKLERALGEFKIDVTGLACADFGCSVGGFTDCLLQHGANKVYAIDTGYGVLAYTLRTDPRVEVMERTNVLHAKPQAPIDLVVIDLAWTPQQLAIPAALKWLKPDGRIISLVKPHYELDEEEKRNLLTEGRLDHLEAERVLDRVLTAMPTWGAQPIAHTRSPLTGGKSSRQKSGAGNIEFLVLVRPI